ncbi:MinD/ParA family ATP-binding protein [Nocardia alni]|uniref:MinD/ParA family ATP-binding protein n=1 Tax=Nocardia alni TaxID=2815723 RepID=UPI001C21AF0A|nr:ParA family protein [Nocardia alni]
MSDEPIEGDSPWEPDESTAVEAIDGDRADYTAEDPVDLRRQRLRGRPRRVSADEPDEERFEDRNDDADPVVVVDDPYGVGAENLSTPMPDPREIAAVREARLAMLRNPAPGVETDPALWGWRGKLNSLGLRLRPHRMSGEVVYRRAVERIRQPLPGTPLVVVANPKGGTGVSPAVVLLSALFARHRGGQVVAWDANEACGTLGDRAAVSSGLESVWDVLGHARELCSANTDASGLGRFLHRQPTLDEVLAADDAPGGSACIGAEECAAIWAVLRRHRSLVVADTGDNERAAAFRWTIEHATVLVVPVIGRRDAVVAALRLLDGVADNGREDLAEAAIIVLAETGGGGVASEALTAAGIQRVVRVPFDAALASGERIVVTRLPRSTIAAWTQVVATVADGAADALAGRAVPLESGFVPESRWTTPGSEQASVRQRRMLAYSLHHAPTPMTEQHRIPSVPTYSQDPGW